MGQKSTKTESYKQFNKIAKEKKNDNDGFMASSSIINLTNDIIVGKSVSEPNLDYKKINVLGEGSFATVYKVQNRITNSVRAMKVINKSETYSAEDEQEIVNEINILRTMDHPNVLKIFEFYSSKSSYSIVTEICLGGELFQEIIDNGPFTENYSAYVMYQVFSAINYCHNMNIIHRDLKPENILIVDKDKKGYPFVKVCDFGTSKMMEKGVIIKKLVGSSYYIAPEVIKKHYNEKCDLWSCGVILYILLSGRPPFGGETDNEIMERVSKGVYDLSSPPFNKISSSAKDLIQKLLVMNPEKRITAEQVLKHIWFKENKSKELYNQITDENILKKMLANLKSYKHDTVIQETALAYLVHNFPQMNDVINACKLFNKIDINGDGKINQQEFLKGLKDLIKSDSLEQDVAQIYKNIDMDNNGYLEYEEFVRAAVNKEKFMNENVLKFAFRYFDKDGSGEITFDEIEEVFAQSIPDKSKVHESLKKIIHEVDTNGDGNISYEEFANAMKRMLRKKE